MIVRVGRRNCIHHSFRSRLLFFSTLLFIVFCISTPSIAQVSYTYDTYSGAYAGTPNGQGRVTSVTDPTGSTTFFYDARGNVIKTIKVIEGNSFTLQNTYDSLNRLTNITYPDTPTGEVVTYTYDAAGNLKTATSPATSYVTNINYNAFNQRTTLTFGNGTSTSYSYDPNSFRLSQIYTTGPGPTDLEKLNYTYDNVGNVLSITDLLNSANNQSFTYDDINRLNTAVSTSNYGNLTYKYDPIGNIRCNPQVSACVNGSGAYQDNYTYPSSGVSSVQPHAVMLAGSNSYFYDANGNMICNTAFSACSASSPNMVYDNENRLTSIVNNVTGKTVTMAYDYNGNRVRRSVGPTTPETRYYVGDSYEKTSTDSVKYIFAGATRVALKGSDGIAYFYHSNYLGSTHLMTGPTGAQAEDIRYAPFGNKFTNSDTGSINVKHKYTGQELDSDGQLYYYKARYYDHVLGRFTTPDTIGVVPINPQTLNRYSYVLNNPLRFNDPTGHQNNVSDWYIGGNNSGTIGFTYTPGQDGRMQMIGPTGTQNFNLNSPGEFFGVSQYRPQAGLVPSLESVSNFVTSPLNYGTITTQTQIPGLHSTRQVLGFSETTDVFALDRVGNSSNSLWNLTLSPFPSSFRLGEFGVVSGGMSFTAGNSSVSWSLKGPNLDFGPSLSFSTTDPKLNLKTQTTFSMEPMFNQFAQDYQAFSHNYWAQGGNQGAFGFDTGAPATAPDYVLGGSSMLMGFGL